MNQFSPTFWDLSQILFKLFPDLENAYKLSEKLKFIYNSKIKKEIAITKLAHWYKDVEESGLNSFNTIKNTIQLNYGSIAKRGEEFTNILNL